METKIYILIILLIKMKKVILDSSFILTCVKQKIDFFEEIKLMGISIIIPEQVIEEIKKVADSKKKLHFREDAKLALKIIRKNKFKKIDLKSKYVDTGLIAFSQKNKDVLIATLDSELKRKIKSNKLVIREKKRLEVL